MGGKNVLLQMKKLTGQVRWVEGSRCHMTQDRLWDLGSSQEELRGAGQTLQNSTDIEGCRAEVSVQEWTRTGDQWGAALGCEDA